jgi:hypothetical protein
VSREHVFPESVGNEDLVLPPGVVCDRCNNGSLSVLDKAFCDLHPINLRRTLLGIPNRNGTIPTVRYSGGTLKFISGGDGGDPILEIRSTTSPRLVSAPTQLEDGRVEVTLKGSGGRRMTEKYAAQLSRSLLKIALESGWIDHGQQMYEPRFDYLRSVILGVRFKGLFAIYKNVDSTINSAQVTYNFVPTVDGVHLSGLEFDTRV